MDKKKENNVSELKRGVMVFVGLAILTVIEFVFGIWEVASIFLWIIALTKAGLVIWFFMHIFRLFGVDREVHS